MELATSQIKQLFTGLSANLQGWIEDSSSLEPVISMSYPGKVEYHYLETDSPLAKIHKTLFRAFKGQEVYITSQTRNGRTLVVRVSSDVNPGEYYLFDTRTRGAEFLSANRSWINPASLRPMKPVMFESRDGVRVKGYLTLPELIAGSEPPLVVIPHGDPHGVRDYWDYDSEVQLLANRGYAVLQINFRGSGGYGDAFHEMAFGNGAAR
jgi:dipeptidyl aminopeptidase/acylaminoacyl peptidase